VRPIWASSMIKTAERLAGKGAGAGRPALTDLRRATSTAYYALFHQLTRHGAFFSVPTATEDEVAVLARWFTHTGMVQAASWVVMAASHSSPPKEAVDAVGLLRTTANPVPPPQLLTIAEAFVELQAARHDADYSNAYDPVRYVTLDHVKTADAAVRAAWSLWQAGESADPGRQAAHDSYRRFLQLALLKSGGPRRR
jgi:hypothetical protein